MDLSNNVPKVSVIVPIYHSEAYLERCCRSLMSQTLDSIEYLFIIDGPSSEARQIVERVFSENAQRLLQIQIIEHPENLGISVSRQEGHDRANGEYIYHCDSDDWMEFDALHNLLEKAETENADLVFFDYVRHYADRQVVYSSESVLQGKINTIDAPLHNKLIRRQLIKEHALRFPKDINWGEDLFLSVLCQILAKKIAYLPQSLYHQMMHPQSYTSMIDRNKYLQLVQCPHYLTSELKKIELDRQYEPLLLKMKFEVKEYFLIERSLRDIHLWKSLYPETHPFVWHFTEVPLYLRLVSWLITHQMSWFAEALLSLRDQINKFRY